MVFKRCYVISIMMGILACSQALGTEAQLRAQLSSIDQQLGQQLNKSPREIQQILNRKKTIQTQLDTLKNQPLQQTQAAVQAPVARAVAPDTHDQSQTASAFSFGDSSPDTSTQEASQQDQSSPNQGQQSFGSGADQSQQQPGLDQGSAQTSNDSTSVVDSSSSQMGGGAGGVDLGPNALMMVTDVDKEGFINVMKQLTSVFDAGSSQYSVDALIKIASKAHDLVVSKKLKKIAQAEAYAAMVASGARAAKEKRQFCNDTMSSVPLVGSGAKLKGWNEDVQKLGPAGPNVPLDINFVTGRLATQYANAAQHLNDIITKGTTFYGVDDLMIGLKAALPQQGRQYSPDEQGAMQALFTKVVAIVHQPEKQRPLYQGKAFSDGLLKGQKKTLENMLATVKGSKS